MTHKDDFDAWLQRSRYASRVGALMIKLTIERHDAIASRYVSLEAVRYVALGWRWLISHEVRCMRRDIRKLKESRR